MSGSVSEEIESPETPRGPAQLGSNPRCVGRWGGVDRSTGRDGRGGGDSKCSGNIGGVETP